MCEFVSWKEYDGKLYYLDNDKLNTKDGRALIKFLKDENSLCDLCGHGAIERYYPEIAGKGHNKEVTNFSSPDNFPLEISKKIKAGKMSEIIFEDLPLALLNNKGIAEYHKIQQPAWAEYQKIEQQALAEYQKIEQQASAEYLKIQQPAWAEYHKIQQQAFWSIFKDKKYREKEWR